ncbi:unnamed protein product [Chondrus crispus]|uniref:Uncharacterized protein n=1 Tax=Chondrus crispus TaxID=2769 RepID=R7QA74_CHOCR|nr:unnamed protein product [Chondrus crispus]CDF34316.1 unnamed protein product [Chondrus crispus]|eukprot:XP_005714135.1 unnamed protein product [Chondrus crispus]
MKPLPNSIQSISHCHHDEYITHRSGGISVCSTKRNITGPISVKPVLLRKLIALVIAGCMMEAHQFLYGRRGFQVTISFHMMIGFVMRYLKLPITEMVAVGRRIPRLLLGTRSF